MKKNKSIYMPQEIRVILLEFVLYVILEALVIFANFRAIRESFPTTEIAKNKIIGYSHYYGYPFYFDTFIIFFLLLSPIIICLLIALRRKLISK